MVAKLICIGVGFAVALVAVWRRSRALARRKEMKKHVRRFWQKHQPGELYPECPVCHLPFPASHSGCPFCGNSRVQARALRRDLDWALETASGYEGLDVRLLQVLPRVPDAKMPPDEDKLPAKEIELLELYIKLEHSIQGHTQNSFL